MKSLRAALVLILLLLAAAPVRSGETALDRYIAKPDPEYKWRLVKTSKSGESIVHVLELTSQRWRSEADVDRPIWTHSLTIARPADPAKQTSDFGFLFIGGGDNKKPLPETAPERVVEFAADSGTPVAELGMVPNQPLHFTDSKDQGRYEDDLIAYTRVKYMATHDETWLVRLAMVKSAVRAMDAMQEFLASPDGGGKRPARFMVAGGSKRGWTTWLTAVVDPRVAAIAPMVIDALNSEAITRHHYEAYGFFSKALDDYVRHGLFPGKVGTPDYQAILKIEDAYHYRDRERLKIPKFVINASGDEFFLPDNSQFYYGEMPEEKHIRYVPNAKHSLGGSDARESLAAFYQAVIAGTPRPKFTWTKGKDGSLTVKPEGKPREVTLWRAVNPNARDFRLDVIGKAYAPTKLTPAADGTYAAPANPPEKGYAAFFIELTYDGPGKYPFKFSTEVSVVPDVLPFQWENALKGPVELK